jgi:glyoxylase-like metal-dependent hydrolase (beta-lactamase superfamily II)
VGIVPFLKRRNSKLEVYALRRAWGILHTKKAIDTLNDFSRNVAKRMEREKVYAIYDLDWRDDIRGMAIKEGDRINLGNLEICILDTPGHSSCSISAYMPHFKALFASEAGGIPYKESIIAFGNSNFTEFQQNLKKLKDLDVECFCADHYGYVVGEEARNIIRHIISVARKHRASIKEAYRCTGNIETAAYQLTNAFHKENPDWIVSPEIVEGVYRQMLRHIVNTKEEYA